MRQPSVLFISSVVLAATMATAALMPVSAAAKKAAKTKAPSAKLIAEGKKIVTAKCIGCHGAKLEGRPKRVPPLTAKGPMRHYNQALFERLMAKSVDEENKPIAAPMNRVHLSKADSDAVWSYLKTIK